jgi:hypothetical protein
MTRTVDQTNAREYVGEAMRGQLDDLAALQQLATDRTYPSHLGVALESLGVEFEGGEPLEDQAERLLDEYPLCVERTVSFEIVLGTGGPDSRLIVECDVDESRVVERGDLVLKAEGYEIRRVLFRYSWEGSGEVELYGDDKAVAEAFARRVVPELVE